MVKLKLCLYQCWVQQQYLGDWPERLQKGRVGVPHRI